MFSNLGFRRAIATSAALTVAGWGAFALPAVAAQGNGDGNGNGNGEAHVNAPGQPAGSDHGQPNGQTDGQPNPHGHSQDPHGPKDHGTNGHGQGNGQGHGQGHGNGNGQGHGYGHGQDHVPGQDHGQDHGQGNGEGPKDGHGPKGGGGSGDHGGGHGDPPGNNGTVKITPIGEDDGIPQNTPHVVCGFDIEWYGFDEGPDIVSTVTFTPQAPTSDVVISGTEPSTVFVGGDPASGAGTDSGFDGEATYHLGFTGDPHPQQGYHVKLTVHTPGSQGADTKYKVFWVEPCTPEEPVVTPPEQGTSTETESSEQQAAGIGRDTTSDAANAAADDQAADVAADSAADTAADTAGDTARDSAADVPNRVDAGEGSLVHDVVTSPVGLLLIALGLGLAGAALVARRRSA